MELFANRLRERAEQLRISNSEVARRLGLDERRYGHYVTGRNEPDIATIVRIADVLGTTPNWLMGVDEPFEGDPAKVEFVERFKNAAMVLDVDQLSQLAIQAEAVAAARKK